jgi:hypothetical protein
MPNKPSPGTGGPRTDLPPDVARGIPLAVYSVVGGVIAVGVSTVVIRWLGGNPLDWLTLLIVLVLVSGWYAAPVLRWLSSWRR